MVSKLQKDNKGFTIIEVLIVLAIAGLIMLIVFLAIPALQRSQRNTQRKNDASAVATAANTVASNTNGSLPKELYPGDGNAVADTTLSLRHNVNVPTAETVKLGHYKTSGTNAWAANAGSVYVGDYTGTATLANQPAVVAAGATTSATSISRETMSIILGYKCNSTGTGVDITAGKSPRSVSVLYVNEAAAGVGSLQCVN